MGYSYLMSIYYPKQKTSPSEVKQEEKNIQEKEISIEDSTNLPQTTIGNFVITYSPRGGYIKKIAVKAYQQELLPRNIGLTLQDKDKDFVAEIQRDKIIFIANQGEKKEFIFQDYTLKIKLSPSPTSLVLFSNSLNSKNLEQIYPEFFYYQNNNFQKTPLKKIKEETLSNVTFAGLSEKHFCLSLLKGSYSIKWIKSKDEIYLTLIPSSSEVSLYVGPQIEKQLKPFGLQGIINYGFFHSIGVGLVWLLQMLHTLTKSWGISIILLAILTYLILLPFTAKSTKAMKRMQAIQPEIEELRKKYRDTPQKLNKETLELYKKYKINPLGGCLPLFLQAPVFIALWQVLMKFVELKGAKFLWIKDLSLPDHAFKLSLPPPIDYINLLPILIMIMGLLQQKIAISSSVSSEQKSLGLIMSLFMGVIFYNFPSCLTLYWLTQNVLTFTYQLRATRS
jgi:YidC/Oxa1 family membrane protein insertase